MNKNIWVKLFLFIFLVILFDRVGGLILRNLYFNQKTGPNYSLNYTFKECKADILIFGASQALHNYDSRIISDSLKMSCYNAGQDGGHSIIMQYAQIKAITERYSPKIVILEFNSKNIVHYTGDYDRLSILLPYYNEYPELESLILLRSPNERVKLFSEIYPFNSNILNIIRFNFNIKQKKDFEGYIPIKDREMNLGMIKNEQELIPNAVIDTNMTNSLKNIISICKEKRIKLIIVSSPIFHDIIEKRNFSTPIEDVALEIIHKENVTHFDYSYDSLFTGRLDLFADKNHLNEKGATIFSRSLVKKIKMGQIMN